MLVRFGACATRITARLALIGADVVWTSFMTHRETPRLVSALLMHVFVFSRSLSCKVTLLMHVPVMGILQQSGRVQTNAAQKRLQKERPATLQQCRLTATPT